MDDQQIPQHFFLLLPFFFMTFAVVSIILVIPYWQIFKKAGFTPWLALLMFVPLANVIILYVVAFSQWRVGPVPTIYPAQFPPQYAPPTYQPPARPSGDVTPPSV